MYREGGGAEKNKGSIDSMESDRNNKNQSNKMSV